MRAMRMHGYGGPEVIRPDRIEQPEPGPGEVLIRVAATTFNPSEAGLRRGLLRSIVPVVLPYTMGLDVAGTLAEGDRVIGRLDGGAAADFAIAPKNVLVRVPDGVPLEDAAALPIAGLTAWQAVFEHAAVTEGQRVLVNGAGAIGRYAIQLARQAGAHVVAAASPRSAGAAHEAGADRVVVGGEEIEPVDALIHLVPAEPAYTGRIRPGGVLVSATTPADRLPAGPFRGVHFIVRNDTADLTALLGLVAAGRIRIDIAGRRPLTDLAAVHAEAEAGELTGKTLLLP